MPKRHICQGDIFKFINDELNISQKSLCLTIDKVRTGTMVESRISEIKRGKRKGYKGLENKEDWFFDECFTGKDEELGLKKVLDFINREELFFPGVEIKEEDNYKSYSLRMLKYGLENRELPISNKNLIYEEEEEDTAMTAEEIEELNFDTLPDAQIPAVFISSLTAESKEAKGFFSAKLIKDIKDNWLYVYFCAFCLLSISIVFNIYAYSALDIFLWMNNLPSTVFFTIILILAISTLIFGLLDTAIAIYTYKRNNRKHEKLNWQDIYLIAKYGDKERIISGRGRYDLGIDHLCYSIFCNIAGAFSSLTLYSFLKTLKGFDSFVKNKHLNTMSDIGLILILMLAFANNFLLFTREPMKEFHEKEENPDTLRVDRFSVIANDLHIIVNLYFSYAAIIFAFMYGFSKYPVKSDMSSLFSLAITGVYLYLWFSSVSPYAVEFNAQCAGSFLLISPFIAASTSLYTIMCFYPSANYFVVIGINVLGMLVWLISLFKRGNRSILPVVWNNKIYFTLYGILMLLFYALAISL